ncbi:unnamed protein product [Meganyctiphanes norvegica]|uniref:Uncharacterized protein n=2 Tax=Meganyctiphanes norvegica TaxID=48144 RepID=A0AAV2S9N2_MEGNR
MLNQVGSLHYFSKPNIFSPRTFVVADEQQRPGVSSQPIHFHSSRMETMRLALRVSGYSDAAINILLLAHKPGTTKQYQAVWTKFCAFLSMSRLTSKDVSLGVVCEFLAYHSRVYKRKYRTLATYKSALRHPVLFSCNVEINCISFELFMRGLFNLAPPSRAKETASWSLNDLLLFLLTSQFEPLESATFIRLTQKALCLILLASGRRIGEIANLTRNYEEIVSPPSISLIWAPEFVPKHHTPTFQSCYPSIDYLNSKVASDRLLCPVRAYKVLLDRCPVWWRDVPPLDRHTFLWSHNRLSGPVKISNLTSWFKSLVVDSRKHAKFSVDVPMGPHQM